MIIPLVVPLGIDRAHPRVFRIRAEGVDLTGATWHAQIRSYPDAPGVPVLDLPQVTGATTAGVRLVGVDASGLLPVSTLDVQIPASATFPPASAPGGDVSLAWDLFVAPSGLPTAKWLAGVVTVTGTVTRDVPPPPLVPLPDVAPADLAIAFTAADLTLTLSDTDLLALLVEQARSYADAATDSAGDAQAYALTAQASGYPAYDTKAAAIAALGSISGNALINVMADESQSGSHTIYRQVGGVLVLVSNASAIVQPISITYQPAVLDEWGNNSQVLYRRPAPSADGWGDLTVSMSGSALTNNGNYVDNGYMLFGFNAQTSFGARDATKPSTQMRAEERYWSAPSSCWVSELHYATIYAGGSSEHRWMSWAVNINAADWRKSEAGFAVSNFRWKAGDDTVHMQWELGAGSGDGFAMSYATKSYHAFGVNNYAVLQQANAAGDANIQFVIANARDETEIRAASYQSGSLLPNVFGNKAIQTVLYNGIDTASGTVNIREWRGSASAASGLLVQAEAFYQDAVAGLRRYFYNGTGDCWSTFVANGHTFSIGAVAGRNSLVIAKGDTLGNVLVEFPNAGGMFIADSASAPATPVAGSAIYSLSGSLKAKGSGGTVTTVGAA